MYSVLMLAALTTGPGQCANGQCGRIPHPLQAFVDRHTAAGPATWTTDFAKYIDDNGESKTGTRYLKNGVCYAFMTATGTLMAYDAATNAYGPVLARGPLLTQAGLDASPEEAAMFVEQNFGIDKEEMLKDRGRTSINGKTCTATAGKDALVDDSKKKFVTVIGADATLRAQVEKDWDSHPALKDLKDKYHFQSYAADNPMVSTVGFQTAGSPTIYVQATDGKDLLRLDSYPGPEKLAEAVRQADPSYAPAKDPTGQPALSGLSLASVPTWVWVTGGVLGLLYFTKRK